MNALKVLVAPDSFKGSLGALDAAEAIAKGLRQGWPELDITLLPVADGGEGTAEVLTKALRGRWREVPVVDPLGRALIGHYGLVGNTIVMDIAEASGLQHLSDTERNPWNATSFGSGQLLKAALQEATAQRLIIGLGGSATVDGGIGFLQALGAKILDGQGDPVVWGGQGLAQVETVAELHSIRERLKCIEITVACDVRNPLLGPEGAAHIYGPQKGASPEMVDVLEQSMTQYAAILQRAVGENYVDCPGAGAAGGLGFALYALGASFRSGAEVVLEILDFEQQAIQADLVITGEGMIDRQTLYGKTIMGILAICGKVQTPVILLAGAVHLDPSVAGLLSLKSSAGSNQGAAALLDSIPSLMDKKDALDRARLHLEWSAEQSSRLLRLGGSLCGS
ncbi:MAG: glycerate kinase [Gloeobacterales cyanobacterium]